MAEQKKPATSTRKKTTKRGPTKATALKTLGISPEDLELLKKLKEAREGAESKDVTIQAPPAQSGVDIVEPVAAQQESKQGALKALATEQEAGPFFIRNLRNTSVHFRLTRQEGQSKKRTNLEPRGSRGDLAGVELADLQDDELTTQIAYGVVEVITAAEAKKIIDGQAVNQQQRVHPAMAMLRNELGKPYKQTEVPVVGDNSYTVAHLAPQGGEAGELPSQGRGVDWNAIHGGNAGVGGNPAIVSDGFAQAPDVAADIIARRKDIHGPAAGLGGVTVTIEETQRT